MGPRPEVRVDILSDGDPRFIPRSRGQREIRDGIDLVQRHRCASTATTTAQHRGRCLPENVIGFEAIGEVRAGDYESVLDPALDTALAVSNKIRCLYVLGDEFEAYSGGAAWKDTKVGLAHWSSFERIALVTDHGIYRDALNVFGWMIPGEVQAFSMADLDGAKA